MDVDRWPPALFHEVMQRSRAELDRSGGLPSCQYPLPWPPRPPPHTPIDAAGRGNPSWYALESANAADRTAVIEGMAAALDGEEEEGGTRSSQFFISLLRDGYVEALHGATLAYCHAQLAALGHAAPESSELRAATSRRLRGCCVVLCALLARCPASHSSFVAAETGSDFALTRVLCDALMASTGLLVATAPLKRIVLTLQAVLGALIGRRGPEQARVATRLYVRLLSPDRWPRLVSDLVRVLFACAPNTAWTLSRIDVRSEAAAEVGAGADLVGATARHRDVLAQAAATTLVLLCKALRRGHRLHFEYVASLLEGCQLCMIGCKYLAMDALQWCSASGHWEGGAGGGSSAVLRLHAPPSTPQPLSANTSGGSSSSSVADGGGGSSPPIEGSSGSSSASPLLDLYGRTSSSARSSQLLLSPSVTRRPGLDLLGIGVGSPRPTPLAAPALERQNSAMQLLAVAAPPPSPLWTDLLYAGRPLSARVITVARGTGLTREHVRALCGGEGSDSLHAGEGEGEASPATPCCLVHPDSGRPLNPHRVATLSALLRLMVYVTAGKPERVASQLVALKGEGVRSVLCFCQC